MLRQQVRILSKALQQAPYALTPRPTLACSLSGRATFATSAYTVPSKGSTPEQTLFVVGLNEGKFFGQDSAEEALKLVEHVATASPEYTLLFGISEPELTELESDHKVKSGRLTPSRELEGKMLAEHVPIVQAGMVDKRPRRAVGRNEQTTKSHVSYLLWTHPREAVNVYWAYWRRKQYKDIEKRKFWSKTFPVSATAYFEERAALIAIRATEHVAALRAQESRNSTVLVVNNDIYDLVLQELNDMLGKDATEKLNTQKFSRKLRERAGDLCQDILDLWPLLFFIYFMVPLTIVHWFVLGADYYIKKSGVIDELLGKREARRRE
mmetsp:Transcript_89758/g.159573  ORF Transcript_89758/g.159573 Transcript_89758/m.159573 type:complete len:324 (-) Transcript_89758:22-993(-)